MNVQNSLDRMLNTKIMDMRFGNGLHVIVDGQYGSTGKGKVAAALVHELMRQGIYAGSLCNAGPNSGHTHYDLEGDNKYVLKQLPSSWVEQHTHLKRNGNPANSRAYLTGGAIINPTILSTEVEKYNLNPRKIYIHEHAALIFTRHIRDDKTTEKAIASTAQGVGPALQEKIGRHNPSVVAKAFRANFGEQGFNVIEHGHYIEQVHSTLRDRAMIMEVSQGYSLGLISGQYPHVTSRECTVAQACADAGISPALVASTTMVVRPFPIRVGNAGDTSSGPCYPDQQELNWSDIRQKPELTTVTKRPRRLFTWSAVQYRQSLLANTPDAIYVNFMNYLPEQDWNHWLIENVIVPYKQIFGIEPIIFVGTKPQAERLRTYH